MELAGSLNGKALLASGFHAPRRGAIDSLVDALISVDVAGAIESVLRPADSGYGEAVEAAAQSGRLERLPAGIYLLPGFVDTHVHAPQYPQLGQALDVPLEDWLQKRTFPLEARYADLGFARRAYTSLVDELLSHGTTTALYYATIHRDATRLLADICLEMGQRALVGKVAMDHPGQCPSYYRDASADASIRGTADLFEYVRRHPDNPSGRVLGIVTPRFIPSCTDEALLGLGGLAVELGAHVQTHCSEGDWEHGHVFERFGMSDAESLDNFGLLRRRSVLGHCTHLSDSDMDLIKARGSSVSHCPLSNAYFAGAVFPLRAALEKGVSVALGTDVSGGPSSSMLDSMRQAIASSRILESGVDASFPPTERRGRPGSRIDFRDAFHIATAGGGYALDLPIGRFEPGCRFDALAVATAEAGGSIRLWDGLDSGEGILQKIVYAACRSDVAAVWVDGRRVKPKDAAASRAPRPSGSSLSRSRPDSKRRLRRR